MKRSILELRNTFKRKVNFIEKLLSLASNEDILSEERREILTQIAVELRALFCYSGGSPLIETAQMDKELMFPMNNWLPYNELSDFLLVGYNFKNGQCCFRTSIDLDNKVPYAIMSYSSWIHEIVIDLRMDCYPPLTRLDVIKIVADKEGAHVDTNIHEFVELIESRNVMPIKIVIDDKECDADCGNLLYETIYSISLEVLYSYKYLNKPVMRESPNKSKFEIKVFDFSDKKNKRYKFLRAVPQAPHYNSNKSFSCNVTSHPIEVYDMLFRSKMVPMEVCRIEKFEI